MTDTHFFICLTRPNSKRWSVKSVMGFLTAWLLVQMLVICFQCRLPEPWRIMGNKCVNLVCLLRGVIPFRPRYTPIGRPLIAEIVELLDKQRSNRCHNADNSVLPSRIPSFRPPSLQHAKDFLHALVYSKHDVRYPHPNLTPQLELQLSITKREKKNKKLTFHFAAQSL